MNDLQDMMKAIDALGLRIEQLSAQLRSVGQDIPREIDSYHYLQDQLNPIARIRPAGAWAAPYETIARLVEIVLKQNRELIIVELGGGISTLWIGYALRKIGQGKIYSIEHDRDFFQLTSKQLREHDLENWVELVYSPINEQTINDTDHRWYSIDRPLFVNSEIDILIVDGPPGKTADSARWPAFPFFSPHLKDGAFVLLDDVDRKDEWNIGKRWTNEYNESGKLNLAERLGRSSLYKFNIKT